MANMSDEEFDVLFNGTEAPNMEGTSLPPLITVVSEQPVPTLVLVDEPVVEVAKEVELVVPDGSIVWYICLDGSGSMDMVVHTDIGREKRCSKVLRDFKELVNALLLEKGDRNIYVYYCWFNHDVQEMSGPCLLENFDIVKVAPEPNGGTALYKAVDYVMDIATKNTKKARAVVFLLTDGEDTDSMDLEKAAREKTRRDFCNQHHVKVHVLLCAKTAIGNLDLFAEVQCYQNYVQAYPVHDTPRFADSQLPFDPESDDELEGCACPSYSAEEPPAKRFASESESTSYSSSRKEVGSILEMARGISQDLFEPETDFSA